MPFPLRFCPWLRLPTTEKRLTRKECKTQLSATPPPRAEKKQTEEKTSCPLHPPVNFQSVMDRPDRVSRVTPPSTTMLNTHALQPPSHHASCLRAEDDRPADSAILGLTACWAVETATNKTKAKDIDQAWSEERAATGADHRWEADADAGMALSTALKSEGFTPTLHQPSKGKGQKWERLFGQG